MLLQIPIFFALYKVLFVTIEMRHAPFYGWIRDLSAPDPTNLFNLFGLLPYDPATLPRRERDDPAEAARLGAAARLRTSDDIARELRLLTGVAVTARDIADVVVQRWTDAVDIAPAGSAAARLARASACGGWAGPFPRRTPRRARLR